MNLYNPSLCVAYTKRRGFEERIHKNESGIWNQQTVQSHINDGDVKTNKMHAVNQAFNI